jgi:hypothetical protein
MPDPSKTAADPSSIESDLKALATNSNNLNRLTDDLSNYVETIESTINVLNPGLKVSVVVARSSYEDGTWSHYVLLWYDKIEGKWGLAVEEYDQNEEDPDAPQSNRKTWAFKDAPRALRLQVVTSIHDLIKALVKESESMARATEMTVARAKEIASSVRKLQPPVLGKLSQLSGK